MEALLFTFAQQFLPIVLPILLTWAAARYEQWVKAHIKNEKLRTMLLSVDDAVKVAILSVQQTYLDDIKKSLADGKLTSAEKQHAARLALAVVKQQLPPEILALLQATFGDKLDAWLTTRIEASVQLKKLTSSAAERLGVPGL